MIAADFAVGLVVAIVTVVVGAVGIIATIVGGFAWLSHQLTAIRREIASLDKTSVSHQVCSEHRHNCPCVSDIAEIKAKLER